jgi:predicted metal-binding protein
LPDAAETPVLHICTTCRAGRPLAEGEVPPGRHLHDAVAAALAARPDAPVALRAVTCMAACDHGCAAAMTAPGKWGYLLGRLDLSHAADLLDYGAAYAAHATGAVLPSRRPASLRSVVLGRIPSLLEPQS